MTFQPVLKFSMQWILTKDTEAASRYSPSSNAKAWFHTIMNLRTQIQVFTSLYFAQRILQKLHNIQFLSYIKLRTTMIHKRSSSEIRTLQTGVSCLWPYVWVFERTTYHNEIQISSLFREKGEGDLPIVAKIQDLYPYEECTSGTFDQREIKNYLCQCNGVGAPWYWQINPTIATIYFILKGYFNTCIEWMMDERLSSSCRRKTVLSPKRGSNPQSPDDRWDAPTIELPKLRRRAKVQVRNVRDLRGSHDILIRHICWKRGSLELSLMNDTWTIVKLLPQKSVFLR